LFIYDYTKDELLQYTDKSFRASQIYKWIYQKYVDNFDAMSDLSKEYRENLKHRFSFDDISIAKIDESKIDGTKKYLFRMKDGHTVESVFLLMKDKEVVDDKVIKEEQYTVCLSTQVGCKVGCAFCLTAKGGFVRNLTVGEIIYQVVAIKKDNNIDSNRAMNVVFMGMGEPLDNFENLMKAIEILNNDDGLKISYRRQTISTSGITPKITKLGEINPNVQLAISLHAVDDNTRGKLIPMNKAYNIDNIISTLKDFPLQTRRRFMFEYLMIKNINDSIESAKKLVRLVTSLKVKINLIYFNPYPNSEFERPSKKSMEAFRDYMQSKGVTCTIRDSKGIDIMAACGQLRESDNDDIR
jgi:23S rRNA (adenine2503-C2)-methyltransferase